MSAGIEVRVKGKGAVKDGTSTRSSAQVAHCDLCDSDVDMVASAGPGGGAPFGCKGCLRERLEALTLGSWVLRDPGEGLPWGKVSG
ncbi:MAG TPA: hypothetical protein VL400_14780 [Polyangiaceae bacterium]|jgi:hypothetical protein|nr:hypothetical protein [Polyangiaceae bacterium]